MEVWGFEPQTFSMPLRRAPNCATPPRSYRKYPCASPAYYTTRHVPCQAGEEIAGVRRANLERVLEGLKILTWHLTGVTGLTL